MEQGRRYATSQIFVKDWDTFKSVWKDNSFIKQLANIKPDEQKELVRKKFEQLIRDQAKQCYIFPDSLKPDYLSLMIDLAQSQQFKYHISYQHEGMYLDKPKQLVVYKKRASVASYLGKYRHPSEYKKAFQGILETTKQYQKLIIERNIKISQQLPNQQIQYISKQIQQFKKTKLQPKLDIWRKLVNRMMKDYHNQPKKYQMLFIGVNSIIYGQLKQLCSQHQLYVRNRFENISKYDQYRDVSITKFDANQKYQPFDDNSSENFNEQNIQYLSNKSEEEQKQIVIKVPKNIQNVEFIQFVQNGLKCKIYIFSFGKINPVQYIRVRLLLPNETEQQKQYQRKINIIEGVYQYQVILNCFKTGCSTFQITAVNSVGVNKVPYIYKIWFQAIKDSADNEGIMKVELNNYQLYLMGKNQQGLIPNWSDQNNNTIITTFEKWEASKYQCCDFSVSSHALICNKKGSIASWGKMYFLDENGLNQEQSDSDEDGLENLVKLNQSYFRTQAPSLILEKSKIRKVSCGEGYCLMVDYLGKPWSFGLNSFGQLGLQYISQNGDSTEPTLIRYFQHQKIFVKDVIASYFGGSFAIDDKGQAYRWGTNQVQQSSRPVKDSYGNIINFQYPEIIAAQSVPILMNKKVIGQKIKSIHPGQHFVLALTEMNKLYGWGRASMLGKGKLEDAHFVAIDNICNPIHIMDSIMQVAVGLNHCLAQKQDNSLVGWGESKYFKPNITTGQFLLNPQKILDNYVGQFVCGPDFTVFNDQPQKIRVVGNKNIFSVGTYNLPCKLIKLQAGQGVIMVLVTSNKQNMQIGEKPIHKDEPVQIKQQQKQYKEISQKSMKQKSKQE